MHMKSIYERLPVFITGDTGFKGSWLSWWLTRLGAKVTGYALPAEYEEGPFCAAGMKAVVNHVDGDVRDAAGLASIVERVKPRIIFHLAAQALVRESYDDPLNTISSNVMGTANLLDAVRRLKQACAVVVVTSDKCYENDGHGQPCQESDRMGGHDPYSASKGCAELVTAAYRRSFFEPEGLVSVATARAGNVIGPGDWAADRLIPDAVRAVRRGEALIIRHPQATRPWQHVLEPLSGYLWLGRHLLLGETAPRYAQAWNFGPVSGSPRPVLMLVDRFYSAFGSGRWTGARDSRQPHESASLSLDIHKAESLLGWQPVWDFDETVARTARGYAVWMKALGDVKAICSIMNQEIEAYTQSANQKGLEWAHEGERT
jgi:CDP-glucose 4,6-dehydratase